MRTKIRLMNDAMEAIGVHLRPIHADDAPIFQDIYEKMARKGQYYAFLRLLEKEHPPQDIGATFVKKRIGQSSEGKDLPSILSLAICSEKATPIGSLSAVFHAPKNWPRLSDNKFCEIECFISPDYQNKGIAFNSVKMLMELITHRFEINRFWATAHPDNKISRKVIEKLGLIYLTTTVSDTDEKDPARLLFVTKNCLDLIKT